MNKHAGAGTVRSSTTIRMWLQVLVVGWGQQGFMEALLHEMDRGDQSLPVGSEVVFMNMTDAAVSVGAAVERVSINCLHISHIQVRFEQSRLHHELRPVPAL